MNVILYMAITVDGLVAKRGGDSSWTSEADWNVFEEITKEAGAVIMGRNTFEMLQKEGMFPFPDRQNIVMTSRSVEPEWGNVVVMSEPPAEVVRALKERGFSKAVVIGGATLAGSFMKEGLINEIYLTVEPIAFGEGMKLFQGGEFEANLDLLDVKKISDNEVQLHYAVRK